MISNFKDPKHAFLSNMYPCLIDCGMVFKCVESAYMAAKCKNEEDKLQFVPLNGYQAKKLGRTILLRPDWDDVRVPTMARLLQLKFPADIIHPNSPLTDMLLDTVDEELVEGNTWGDTFWGVCNGVGQNQLGRLLMARRRELATSPY